MIVDRGFRRGIGVSIAGGSSREFGVRKSWLPESMGLFLACRRSSPLNCWSDLLGESQRFTAGSQRDCADSPPLSGACVSPGASGFYRYPKGLTRAGQSSERAFVFSMKSVCCSESLGDVPPFFRRIPRQRVGRDIRSRCSCLRLPFNGDVEPEGGPSFPVFRECFTLFVCRKVGFISDHAANIVADGVQQPANFRRHGGR